MFKKEVAVTVTEASPLQPSPPAGNSPAALWARTTAQAKDYCRTSLAGDLVAGITVGSVLVPQSMAYALLAGLPPEMGLYSSLLPLLAYAIFGSSPHLAVGPVSVVCVLIAVQMSEMNVPEEEQPVVAIMLALFAGLVLCLLGVAKLGFVACLLSHAVLSGFMTAVAFIIAIEQLDTFCGFKVDTPHGQFVAKAVGIITNLGKSNPYALALGFTTAIIIFASTLVQKRFPTAIWPRTATLLLTILGTFVSWAFDLPSHGVSVVGELPTGFPPFVRRASSHALHAPRHAAPPRPVALLVPTGPPLSNSRRRRAPAPPTRLLPSFDPAACRHGQGLPYVSLSRVTDLLPSVAMLVLVGFVESIAVAKTIAAKVGYEIDADRELIGLGLSNVAAALSGGFPSFGSLSRTPVNYIAGARTRFAGVVTAMLTLVVILFFTPLLRYMPKPVMAAIIIVAVSKMADFAELVHIFTQRKAEAALWLLPFFGTLIIGIDAGLLGSLIVCTLLVINHASLAHATLQVAAAGRVREDEYVEVYIFASQQPPPMPQIENKALSRSCTPALEAFHEVQDPSLGCCYGGGRSAQAAQLTALVAGAPTNGLPVLRLQSPLFYANAGQVRNAIEVIAYTAFPQPQGLATPRAIIVHMHAVTSIDSSALHVLDSVLDALKIAGGIRLAMVQVNPQVLKALTVCKLVAPGGGGKILVFDSVQAAATHYLKEQ